MAESSEYHLTPNRAHRTHFFQLEIRRKKRDILSEKLENGMVLKKREFTPESGNFDTYMMLDDKCITIWSSDCNVLLVCI